MSPRAPSQKSITPLQHAALLIHKSDYHGAANILRSAGQDLMIRNALGVCLLRMQQYEEALKTFRAFVLMPGGVAERSDVINPYKRNFALALLMSGSISGAIDVLNATCEPNHVMAQRIYRAIKVWEKSLGWLRWLDWKFNGIEPAGSVVQVDFLPGEFALENVFKESAAESVAEPTPEPLGPS